MAALPNFKNSFLLILLFFSFPLLLRAEIPSVLSSESSRDEAVELALNLGKENPAQSLEEKTPENPLIVPEWVKRTNIAIEAGTDIKPKFFLETIQPLFGTQNKETVLFNQTRVSMRDDRTTYNLGFGLRRIFKESYLLGVNTFYDYQDLHQHHRAGVGLEAITDKGLEARMNGYLRISNKRLLRDDGVNEYYEKVANGLDWELGGPLPYLNFLKLYGGGYWYNFEHFANKYGWQMRMEYDPMKYSRLAFIMFDDNKRNKIAYRFEGAVTLALTSFKPSDILKDLKISSLFAYPTIDLNDKILDRVVRDFDITVITSTKSKTTGLTVEGGKSG